MGISNVVHNHFKVPAINRSPDAIERDRWLEFPPPVNVFGKFVIPGGWIFRVGFNRWLLLPAAFIIQMTTGSVYAWSGYNVAVDTAISGDPAAGQAPIAFYIAIAFLGPCAALFGPWLERVGPRSGALLGGLFYFIANMSAALACHFKLIWLLYVGYGMIGGMGLGLTYITPVGPLQKWFPDWRGLASGFSIAGFGLGSLIASFAQNSLLSTFSVQQTFIILGVCYFSATLLLLSILRVPASNYSVGGVTFDTIRGTENLVKRQTQTSWESMGRGTLPQYQSPISSPTSTSSGTLPSYKSSSTYPQYESLRKSTQTTASHQSISTESALVDAPAKNPLKLFFSINLIDALSSWEFVMMFIMLFSNILLGLTTLSKLQDMVKFQFGGSPAQASLINAIAAICSTCGRILIPSISDKTGRKAVYICSLVLQIAICALLPIAFDAGIYPAFLACVFTLQVVYGAGFGAIPAFLSDLFGSRNVGPLHGVILCAWSIAGCVGIAYNNILNEEVLALGRDSPFIYNKNLHWILPVDCVGLAVTLLIRSNIRDRVMPRERGEFARFRLFGTPIIFTIYGFRIISQDRENRMWIQFLEQNGY
ncbi:MFS general substrate transporter [Gonapodya prolifera JEL478]|uniref:MFS general substrate transporter n=1 Tax=Gonapodya prolifera (strain JEL478) TaxID=1344416 RepID=A0A139AS33_GONPJ|nr:MFS general substrate transporter [Gonapodya prolifera JEL478]|eukprot:KXS19454.1 MFS general substrate transporter [Gonapodya prolifera JEL478]